MAASEIQIFSRMGCKMNDSSNALPTMARKNRKQLPSFSYIVFDRQNVKNTIKVYQKLI